MSQKREKKLRKNRFTQSPKIYLVLYLTIDRVNKYYLLYKNMYVKYCTYTIKNNISKVSIISFFTCQKKEPESPQKNRLQLKFISAQAQRLQPKNLGSATLIILLTWKYSAAARRSVTLATMFWMGRRYIHLITSSRIPGLRCSSSILQYQ